MAAGNPANRGVFANAALSWKGNDTPLLRELGHRSAMMGQICTEPPKTIAHAACAKGVFLLAAYDYLARHHKLGHEELKFLKHRTHHEKSDRSKHAQARADDSVPA